MPKIVIEHEDVGRWSLLNSAWLKKRLYSYTAHRTKVPPGGGTAIPHQEGLLFYTPDDVDAMNQQADPGHPPSIDDVISSDELTRAVEVISDADYTQAVQPDRRRGVLFQLGTFPGEGPEGAHVDFKSVELTFASAPPVTYARDSFFWINVLDESIRPFPINPFHASCLWPGFHPRGPEYAALSSQLIGSHILGEAYQRGKTLHFRLRLDPVVRPREKLSSAANPVDLPPARGGIITYWNGWKDYDIAVQHQTDPLRGAPTYLRFEFTLPEDIFVAVYGWPALDLDSASEPTNEEVKALTGQQPVAVYPDPNAGSPRVEEIHITSTTWQGQWAHGGPGDPGWKSP